MLNFLTYCLFPSIFNLCVKLESYLTSRDYVITPSGGSLCDFRKPINDIASLDKTFRTSQDFLIRLRSNLCAIRRTIHPRSPVV